MKEIMMRQVIAVIDDRTTMVCLRAAGQTALVDEPFEVLTGEFFVPPFHWGCRSAVAPWVPGMINDQKERANAEIRKRPRSERRFGPDGYEGKIPGAPKPAPRLPMIRRGPLPADVQAVLENARWLAEIDKDDIAEVMRLKKILNESVDAEELQQALTDWVMMRGRYDDKFLDWLMTDQGDDWIRGLVGSLRRAEFQVIDPNDVYQYVRRTLPNRPFTEEELDAFAGWIGADHPEVAFRLRGVLQHITPSAEWERRSQEIIRLLDEAFAVSQTTERRTFYRGMLWGVKSEGEFQKKWFKVGDVFTDKSFSSFTSSNTTAMDYALWGDSADLAEEGIRSVIFRWAAPEGSRVIPIEQLVKGSGRASGPLDNEWLVDRETKFRIKSVRQAKPGEIVTWDDQGGGWIVDVEEVP